MTTEFPYIDSFQHFDSIDSTNAEAWRFAQKHPGLNALFVADEQTAGRGRLQRPWQSPIGKGLWWSILLGRDEWLPSKPQLLSLYTGLITKYALNEWTSTPIKLKWPNDLYADGKKISGILIESKWQGIKPINFTLGIGVNLYQQPEDFEPWMRDRATSLSQQPLLKDIHRPDLLAALIDHFFKNWELLNAPVQLIETWHEHALWLNESVEFIGGEKSITGIFKGVDAAGQAQIVTDNGLQSIAAGDLSLRKKQD